MVEHRSRAAVAGTAHSLHTLRPDARAPRVDAIVMAPTRRRSPTTLLLATACLLHAAAAGAAGNGLPAWTGVFDSGTRTAARRASCPQRCPALLLPRVCQLPSSAAAHRRSGMLADACLLKPLQLSLS